MPLEGTVEERRPPRQARQEGSMKLKAEAVEKPWGRSELPPQFAAFADGRKLGEIWFGEPERRPLALLIKYIFTSEKLSVQVHPNDEEARARGLANGKTECWYILDAEPGATIGLGFTQPLSREALRQAALDGSIERLMDWKPVSAGDFLYVPARTVHAIGAGISLVEVQQRSDVTYRLYDYGRPRELHLDDGIAVSEPEPYPERLRAHPSGATTAYLVPGPPFTLVYTAAAGEVDELGGRDRCALPLSGRVEGDGDEARPGECLFVPAGEPLRASAGTKLLIASPGG
jgi:mannose-6-phosphate isomerase